ncbi:DUF1631 domain-containing protein, partial [Pseudomonas syringae pv. tagetis]
ASFDPYATSEFISQLESQHVQAFQHFSRLQEGSDDDAQDDTPPTALYPAEGPPMMAVVEEIVLIAPEERMLNEPTVHLTEDDAGLQMFE